MDGFDEPLNLTIKKMPVSTTLVDLNQNIKTLNTDLIKRDNEQLNPTKKVEDININGINATKNYSPEEGCLDLSKAKIQDELKNNYSGNLNIYDDVYKHSYIYENLSNTYLSAPESIFPGFGQITDNKLLASWYTNSLLNARAYLNLARVNDAYKTKHNLTSDGVTLNNKTATANKPKSASTPHFELIKNEVAEAKFSKNDLYSSLNRSRARAYRGNP